MKNKEHLSSDEKITDEVDLMELLSQIWEGRIIIIKTVTIFIIIGLVFTIGSLNHYKAEVKLLPEIGGNESGVSGLMKQFGGLSSLAGINLGSINPSDALNPTLYPEIVRSTPLMIQLLSSPIKVPSQNASTTLYTYMVELKRMSLTDVLKKYTIGLPGTIKENLNSEDNDSISFSFTNEPVRINKKLSETIEELNNCVQSSVNVKSGIISISAEFTDPEVAAQVAQYALEYLTEFITQYRIEKEKKNLDFINSQCEIAKTEFEKAQNKLADFIDQNKFIVSAQIEGQKEMLQSEYDLTFNVYNSLSQQKEQAKIKVQQETPVFKVLNPIQVPIEKSRPKRSIIMMIILISGVITGIAAIYLKKIYISIAEKRAEINQRNQ